MMQHIRREIRRSVSLELEQGVLSAVILQHIRRSPKGPSTRISIRENPSPRWPGFVVRVMEHYADADLQLISRLTPSGNGARFPAVINMIPSRSSTVDFGPLQQLTAVSASSPFASNGRLHASSCLASKPISVLTSSQQRHRPEPLPCQDRRPDAWLRHGRGAGGCVLACFDLLRMLCDGDGQENAGGAGRYLGRRQ
nr:hypothetical protein CFP56_21276 [Quercus suber]